MSDITSNNEEFLYDVFISYSSDDRDWVRKDLLNELQKAGLKVFIDFQDFKPGIPVVKNIRDGILKSRHTLLILTNAYLKSGWTDFETMLAQSVDPGNRDGRIIPLLKEKCNLPLEIKYLTYLNFFEPEDWNLSWAQLFRALGVLHPAVTWSLKHRYGLPTNFTGRQAEREFLTNWLEKNNQQPLLALHGLGGFGKSALAWFWLLHDVNKIEWKRVLWWGFYDDPSFDAFVAEALDYLNIPISRSLRFQVEDLLKAMQDQRILLVMDGFERGMRAYRSMNAAYQEDRQSLDERNATDFDCISPAADIFLKGLASLGSLMPSKVLITTRLIPRVLFADINHNAPLIGVLEKEVEQMEPADAIEFFYRQGIVGALLEIRYACSVYGFHPLSLRLLAGLVIKDKHRPKDISVANRYEQMVSKDVKGRQHHVLEQSYNGLRRECQLVLGILACFRSSVSYDLLNAIVEESQSGQDGLSNLWIKTPVNLDESLDDLLVRGLIHRSDSSSMHPLGFSISQISTYDLHPIVRRYAYNRLTTSQQKEIHSRVAVHIEGVPVREDIERLEDLVPVIELYHHMVRAGKLDEACDLMVLRFADAIYYQFGAYQLYIELLQVLWPNSKSSYPNLRTSNAQSYVLNALANSFARLGQPEKAKELFLTSAKLDEDNENEKNLIIDLGNAAQQQQAVGALKDAELNLRRCINLSHELEIEEENVNIWGELGRLLSYCGLWQEAEDNFQTAQRFLDQVYSTQSETILWTYRALRFLLMARNDALLKTRLRSDETDVKSTIECASRALELMQKESKQQQHSHLRDYIRINWLLGAAHRKSNELIKAESFLTESLRLCRTINLVELEADILLEIAKLHRAQGSIRESLHVVQEALLITQRSRYVLQGADVMLFLAKLALESKEGSSKNQWGGKETAILYVKEARRLATCDGQPHFYKVAFDEATKMLKEIS